MKHPSLSILHPSSFILYFSFFILHSSLPAIAQTDYTHYQMAGPYAVVARDGEFRASKAGSERDMHAALICA